MKFNIDFSQKFDIEIKKYQHLKIFAKVSYEMTEPKNISMSITSIPGDAKPPPRRVKIYNLWRNVSQSQIGPILV